MKAAMFWKYFFFSSAVFFFTFNVSSWLRNTFDLSASLAFCWLALVVVVCANGGKSEGTILKITLKLFCPMHFLEILERRRRFLPNEMRENVRKKNGKNLFCDFMLYCYFSYSHFPQSISCATKERWSRQERERQEQKNLENQSRKTLAFPKAWRASYSPGSQ